MWRRLRGDMMRKGSHSTGSRIRDLGKITLIRDDTPTEVVKRYPHAGPLPGVRWNEDLIAECWPDLLRMAGSTPQPQSRTSVQVRQIQPKFAQDYSEARARGTLVG